ncbi:hypothetical protein [Larkinella soli]|uniref:hypothetical protein n=1 Tax=Larkinella soli TaxID=1770527 RepID=UPI000FFB1802|nr:hypothetical protein [Larkinella soli]
MEKPKRYKIQQRILTPGNKSFSPYGNSLIDVGHAETLDQVKAWYSENQTVNSHRVWVFDNEAEDGGAYLTPEEVQTLLR